MNSGYKQVQLRKKQKAEECDARPNASPKEFILAGSHPGGQRCYIEKQRPGSKKVAGK